MKAAAVRVAPSDGPDAQSFEWFYELQPPDKMPILDLSLSLKSRFLSRRALDRLNRCMQQRKLIGLAALTANVSYLVTLLAPRSVGCVASILCLVSWTPLVTAGFSSLRYDVIRLLMRTYDFWFLSCVNASVFVVLGLLIGDSRAVALVATWAGVQMNIVVDANIRKVRSWLMFNIIGVVAYSVTWISISFGLIDRMQDFRLVRYRYHELPATSFATNGLITIITVIARNVYRRGDIVRKKHVECVSYRTDLQFRPLMSVRRRCPRVIDSTGSKRTPEYVKSMKYVKQIGVIDARNTLLCRPALEGLYNLAASSLCSRLGHRVFAWLGVLALIVFASGVHYFLNLDSSHALIVAASHVVAFVMTLAYCGTCALRFHRILMLALVTSFDFVFLSVQLTTVHVCLCILFDWEVESTLSITTSWIWSHWFLCLDALPPVMKRSLGITKGFTIAVLLTLSGMCVVLCYLLVFTDLGSAEMYERVLLEMKLFGNHQVQVKLASAFFNCLTTATALTGRLVWRVMVSSSDVLLMLDGVVVYENYLTTAKVRTSRCYRHIGTCPEEVRGSVSRKRPELVN
ncbi:hypothetical protein Gpo141_00013338 [Globisporangium polare]